MPKAPSKEGLKGLTFFQPLTRQLAGLPQRKTIGINYNEFKRGKIKLTTFPILQIYQSSDSDFKHVRTSDSQEFTLRNYVQFYHLG